MIIAADTMRCNVAFLDTLWTECRPSLLPQWIRRFLGYGQWISPILAVSWLGSCGADIGECARYATLGTWRLALHKQEEGSSLSRVSVVFLNSKNTKPYLFRLSVIV